jgi:hypothetical protein
MQIRTVRLIAVVMIISVFPLLLPTDVRPNSDGGGNIALNPSGTGYPHPLESDPGWGCCPNKWAMIDGEIDAPAWYYGFAWTGGTRHWAGGSCGWKQATINFGEPKTFYRTVTYHHGQAHVPTEYKIQYWDGSTWVDIISVTGNTQCQETDPNYEDNCALDDIFTPVTSTKVRYTFDQNCEITSNSDWRYVEHGWIREFEVYGVVIGLEGIPDQCVFVDGPFDDFDLDDHVFGQPPFTWSWSGNVNLSVSIDAGNVVALSYPDGWWGSETITFTVNDNLGNTASDEANFTVCPVPVVLDIPDQNWPFQPFDLDDYLDPACGVDPGDVSWTASGMSNLLVEIDPATHVATVTNPTDPTECENITFTATATPCCVGLEERSDSDDAAFTMLGAICGDVTLNNTNPVANVTVKVIDSENNQVGDPYVTGSDGAFDFDSLLVGTYSVMIVTPLGYSVSPGETQTGVEVTGYPCTEAYFVLAPTIMSNNCRTIGYWKHQFDVYLSGRGHAQEELADLEAHLDLVDLHFQVLGVYVDLENFDFEDAKDVLTVKGGRLMQDRAKQQLFALLLNFASGRIGNETVVSEDDRVAAEGVTYSTILINDGDPANDELAKTICDLINNGQTVGPGIIPESPERYKVSAGAAPMKYALNQNSPNPFNPTTQISYALPKAGHVKLEIYNLLGQRVATLVDEYQQTGQKTINWEAKDFASGIYFYKLSTDDFTATKKMVLTK